MSEQRISDIQAKHSEAAASILNGLYRRYDEIAEEKLDESEPHFGRLDDAQRAAALRDHRLDLATKARREAKYEYTESVREYREKLEARKAEAEAELYGHGDPASADVLARAALASDEELRNLANVASKTNNASLKRAALVVGAERGLGDVLVETFGDQERELYAEIQAAPPAEVLARVTHETAIDTVVPKVSERQMAPHANGTT
jgi:hypothetical protein